MASEPPAGGARRTAAKVLRIAGILAGVLIVLLAAGAAFVSSRGFGAAVEARLAAAVLESKRRTLTFGEPVEFSFWPSAGFVSGPVSLSEAGSTEKFASIAAARCAIAVTPLLAGKIAVERCEIEGLEAEVVRRRDGTLNIDDLLGGPESSASDLAVEAANVALRDATLGWRDEVAGSRMTARDVGFSAAGVKADTGAKTLHADVVSLGARVENLRLRVDLAKLAASPQTATAARMDLDLRHAAGGTAIGAALGSPVSVDLASGRLALDRIEGSADVSHPRLTRPLALSVRGALHADRKSANARLTAGLDESNASLRLDLVRYSPPSLHFDVEVDRLDLDRYLSPGDAEERPAPTGTPRGLGGVDLAGNARIGTLQVAGLTTSNLRLEIRAADGRVEVRSRRATGKR